MTELKVEKTYLIYEFLERDENRAPGSDKYFVRITTKSCSPRHTVALEKSELEELQKSLNAFVTWVENKPSLN